ncbi:hypothetical protein JW921_07715 [Candidatus Fermentibacterales bacterium]|nr:hypothetical protein [Candidatus Fermentibacterales bacterium]
MSALSALPLALCALSGQTEITVLGGLSISDYSMTSQLPAEIDFEEPSSAGMIELRAGYLFLEDLLLGVGMQLCLKPLEWVAESDSSRRVEGIGEGHVELFADWSLDLGPVLPFARLGAALHWGSLDRRYEHGDYVFDDDDGVSVAPGIGLGAGLRLPLVAPAHLHCEADYRLVFRRDFGGWQVVEVDNMNSWRLLLGLGARL